MCASEIYSRSPRTSSPGNWTQLPRNVEGPSCCCSAYSRQTQELYLLSCPSGMFQVSDKVPPRGNKDKNNQLWTDSAWQWGHVSIWSREPALQVPGWGASWCPLFTWPLEVSRLKERKWTKYGGSSPGLRNDFDLPPGELDFALGAKKTDLGVFRFVNLSS